jgi:hypothetical protein
MFYLFVYKYYIVFKNFKYQNNKKGQTEKIENDEICVKWKNERKKKGFIYNKNDKISLKYRIYKLTFKRHRKNNNTEHDFFFYFSYNYIL